MLRICSLLVLLCAGVAQAEIAGPVRVIDGDTLDVGGIRIRLFGIDAPEAGQRCGGQNAPVWPCGAWVVSNVKARLDGKNVSCEALDRDRYGRVVARCNLDGEDIARRLVQDGLAFAYRRYSWDYDLDEKGAAIAGRGLHGTGVQSPAAFRSAARQGAGTPQPDCAIKGNISASGRRVFHVPGQRWYDETRIDESKGERWFCSEADARNAGWRPAKR
ncbi:thermonuclease family protein [Thalassococcus sp. CAU 1522]|uniref:Thermonuclease family protein n=1 Tax=Thalassococcus arenae TaxID=2851652 RepID=A0ABS6N3J0_9RHOB|nr:thermonuclease family protein [Thalassococcus arenae]MBV2358217.1 thermonuclease family protein [Thalassococcus arenae]